MRLIVLLIPLAVSWPVLAQSPKVETDAPVVFLRDMQSGQLLFQRDAQRRIPTASMAKMMTALVVFDAFEKKQIKPSTKYTVQPETWQKWANTGSTMFLRSNERVSVDNLLHGILTVSGNDASVVLAEGLTGSEKAFTQRMNSTAKTLGMRDSRFGTANGWPDEGQTYSTARDLAVLADHIITRHPQPFKTYFGKPEFTWNGVTQPNRNPLIGAVNGADGMKTGHTDEAGYCLVGTAERDGRRLMLVIAGLPTQEARLREARGLINWGFERWDSRAYYRAGAKVGAIPVQLGSERTVSLVAASNIGATFAKGEAPPKTLSVRYLGPVKAPLKKGAQVAELVMLFANGDTQRMPLVTGEAVPVAGFFGRAWNGLQSVVGL
jgi:D-alanyl-D-alanine carboxypeptidase (penicillin-binding protein 5/6)